MEMRDPPEGATLLRVIKTPVWVENQKLAEKSGCPLKVGDKTWTINWDFFNTHLEGNKWGINFDKSCFEEITEEEFKKISNEEPVEVKQELPENGLLVHESGSIIYRTSLMGGFGFDFLGEYIPNDNWTFALTPNDWHTATPQEQDKFIKLLEAEAEKRGLWENTKIKGHADNTLSYQVNEGEWDAIFHLTSAWNKNGQIFHKGTWAEPLYETPPTPSQPEPQRTSEKEVKPRYRIKTKEEFERDGNMVGGYPKGWSRIGSMDCFYGQMVPKSCFLENIRFLIEGWEFNTEHDIVKVSEYPLTPTEALCKTSTLGDISYQKDIEIEKVKKENVKRDFTAMKNIV